jgi:hypothetical protein
MYLISAYELDDAAFHVICRLCSPVLLPFLLPSDGSELEAGRL